MTKKNSQKQDVKIRQGDVLLRRLPGKPADLNDKPVARGRVTLALGETSGHSHVIDGAVAEFRTQAGVRIVWIEAPAELRHVGPGGALTGEHDTAPQEVMQPGWFVYQPQVQLSDDDEVRQVLD